MNDEIAPDVRKAVAEAWSDPQDLRSDAEIAASLDISPAVLKALRRDEDFNVQVTDDFRRQLPSVLPSVLKSLISAVQTKKSVASAKLLLEALGLIESGTKVYNFGGGVQSTGFDFSQLSDTELDRTIQAYYRDAYPQDVVVTGGVLAPDWNNGVGVVEADFEAVEEADQGAVGEHAPGETEEDGV